MAPFKHTYPSGLHQVIFCQMGWEICSNDFWNVLLEVKKNKDNLHLKLVNHWSVLCLKMFIFAPSDALIKKKVEHWIIITHW